MHTIEALIFDVGGVLVAHDNAILLQKILENCEYASLTADDLYNQIVMSGIKTGHSTVREWFLEFAKQYRFKGDYDYFVKLWNCHFSPIKKTLLQLHKEFKNKRKFILSDTNSEHWEFIKNNLIDISLFEGIFLSYCIGLSKPDPALFQLVLSSIQMEPHKCIFIDDKIENVIEARKNGFYTIHYKDETDIYEEFRNIERQQN